MQQRQILTLLQDSLTHSTAPMFVTLKQTGRILLTCTSVRPHLNPMSIRYGHRLSDDYVTLLYLVDDVRPKSVEARDERNSRAVC